MLRGRCCGKKLLNWSLYETEMEHANHVYVPVLPCHGGFQMFVITMKSCVLLNLF